MGHKLSKWITYCLHFCYVLIKIVFRRKPSKQTNNVLIIEDGHIGDVLMDGHGILALIQHYKCQIKSIFVLTREQNWEMLNRIGDMTDVNGIVFDGLLSWNHISRLYALLPSKGFDIIIKITGERRVDFVTASLKGTKIYCIVESPYAGRLDDRIMQQVVLRSVTTLQGNVENHQGRWIEKLLQNLGLTDYQATNLFLPRCSSNISPTGPYISIAVDSASTSKCWPIQNFIDLSDRLLEVFSTYRIFFIGNKVDKEISELINSYVEKKENRVVNFVGRTSMDEWIEIIRGSRFIIGVDSGSIHVAVATGTLSFCLCGLWDGNKCFPYDVEFTAPGTILPVCIYREDVDIKTLSCRLCRNKAREIGSINNSCYSQCCEHLPCLCIQNILVDNVFSTIKRVIKLD